MYMLNTHIHAHIATDDITLHNNTHITKIHIYRIAQSFGSKKYCQIWQMKLYPPMFSPPIILTTKNMEIFFEE